MGYKDIEIDRKENDRIEKSWAGGTCYENAWRALAGGSQARLSSDHQPHFSVYVCVCVFCG